MSGLHDALRQLGHIDWEDIPHQDLAGFLSPCFAAGELLVNSVPYPPNGTAFESAQPHFETPNASTSAKDVYPSPVRPSQPHQDHAHLQKEWGKPMKFGQKENPLHVSLYKMAGHDRHGAWFARHNVLEGIGFTKFKKAMQREFPETLLTKGEPGAGAIRGLSAERRVERVDVEGVGRVEVYQLSAQMPSPVTPREFLTLFLTTEQAPTAKSPSPAEGEYVPRHFMVVSKALHHPDAPERSAYVRGSYESVELVREIPLHIANKGDAELNPLEWIMVTRSDPAGGIPRFLIDRGTPGAMLSDVTKFLNWACAHDEIPDPDKDVEKQVQASNEAKQEHEAEDQSQSAQAAENVRRKSKANLDLPVEQGSQSNGAQPEPSRAVVEKDGVDESARDSTTTPPAAVPAADAQSHTEPVSIMSNLTATLEAGISSYAPVTVSNFVQKQLHPDEPAPDDSSDTSSDSSDSFFSTNEMKRLSTAQEYLSPDPGGIEAASVTSMRSIASSGESSKVEKKSLSRHDKEVLKIIRQREKLDEKHAKKRQDEEAKFREAQDKDIEEQDKAKERLDKEIQKTDERHRREVEKLENKRQRELRKAEEKRKKKEDQNRLSLVARERDDLRSQADLLRRENSLLADQVEALQRENTALARRLGKVGGPDALKEVQDEVKKASSMTSKSHISLASTGSS